MWIQPRSPTPCLRDGCYSYNIGTYSMQEKGGVKGRGNMALFIVKTHPTAYPERTGQNKANPSCKGVGQRALFPGALLLQTEVVLSGQRRCGEWCWASGHVAVTATVARQLPCACPPGGQSGKYPVGKGDHCMSQDSRSI